MDVILAFSSALLGAITLGAILTAEISRAWTRLELGEPGEAELNHYEVAYLAGGRTRVANTAIGLLASEGKIRVARDGRLHSVSKAMPSGFPVEEKVIAVLGEHRGGQPVWDVKRSVARSSEVDAIEERLVELGLLIDVARAPGFATCRRLLRMIAKVAAAAVVAGVILMILLNATAVSVLGVMAFALICLLAWAVRLRYDRIRPPTVGKAGQHHLASARRAHPHSTLPETAAMPVALYGLSSLADRDLAADLTSPRSEGHMHRTQAGGPAGGGCGAGGGVTSDGAAGCSSGGCGGGCGGGGGG